MPGQSGRQTGRGKMETAEMLIVHSLARRLEGETDFERPDAKQMRNSIFEVLLLSGRNQN